MTTFVGGASGDWRVLSISPVKGEGLALVPHLAILDETAIVRATDNVTGASGVRWLLRGVRSYLRYVERAEKTRLDEASPPLGRPEATRAALIPIRKSAAWWDLPQDERRAIFETRSHHIADSMKYMPAVARRLYHARDLGEPFDFLTWFANVALDRRMDVRRTRSRHPARASIRRALRSDLLARSRPALLSRVLAGVG